VRTAVMKRTAKEKAWKKAPKNRKKEEDDNEEDASTFICSS